MAGEVACFSGIYWRTKASLTDFIITLGGVVQEGLLGQISRPCQKTTDFVSERTDGPKVALLDGFGTACSH